jgi:hypothetical protein
MWSKLDYEFGADDWLESGAAYHFCGGYAVRQALTVMNLKDIPTC